MRKLDFCGGRILGRFCSVVCVRRRGEDGRADRGCDDNVDRFSVYVFRRSIF